MEELRANKRFKMVNKIKATNSNDWMKFPTVFHMKYEIYANESDSFLVLYLAIGIFSMKIDEINQILKW